METHKREPGFCNKFRQMQTKELVEHICERIVAKDLESVQMDIYNNVKWEHEVEDDKVCVLHTLAISPRSGKMGLGKQFLRFYEDYALHNGCSELRIDTNELNIIARKMYSKLGYKELSILPTIYNGLPHVNLVLMEKYIGGHA